MQTVVGTLLRLPFCQELTEEQIFDIESTIMEIENIQDKYSTRKISYTERSRLSQTICILDQNIKSMNDFKSSVSNSFCDSMYSATSITTLRENLSRFNWSDKPELITSTSNISSYSSNLKNNNTFANQETAVYMTLCNDYGNRRLSGTQATALVNKCLQVYPDSKLDKRYGVTTPNTPSNNRSICTSVVRNSKTHMPGYWRSSDVYFWGRKKDGSNDKSTKPGMGISDSKAKLHRSGKATTAHVKGTKETKGSASVQAKSQSSSTGVQTGKSRGASASTSTAKSVSIKEDKPERACPAGPGTKEDMVATVTHIRIGPKEPCPIYGKEPCQGPKCKAAPTAEEKAPVKVTTVTNPRRGVFELVIRRLTGAPLAKNELMLEWTPPPSRPQPCGSPCSVSCAKPGPCWPSKCKMIVCRPTPCKPKCCKKGCKKPCGPMPCRSVSCKICCKSSCCGKPCRPCRPCTPCPVIPGCTPCPPPLCRKPCALPCSTSPCSTPCKSSPCLRPCPVGRRKPRRARSQPKIKAHRQCKSPCRNRSKACPVVQCRSVSGPCVACCKIPPCPWPPRKCCSVAPCKSLKCCKSSCSTCC